MDAFFHVYNNGEWEGTFTTLVEAESYCREYSSDDHWEIRLVAIIKTSN